MIEVIFGVIQGVDKLTKLYEIITRYFTLARI